MPPDKPLGIIELLTRVGEDNVGIQNLVECSTRFRARGKRGERHCAVTFLTDQITPTHVMAGKMPKVGLVVWLPTDLVEQARKDHDAA